MREESSWNQWTCPYCNVNVRHSERDLHEKTAHAELRAAEPVKCADSGEEVAAEMLPEHARNLPRR